MPTDDDFLFRLDRVSKVFARKPGWRRRITADTKKPGSDSSAAGPAETDVALAEATLGIRRGEFLCIQGRSGQGKTTLLGLLGGLDVPSAGRLLYEGEPIPDLTQYRRRHVGFIFQMFHLLPYMSALNNVALGLVLSGQEPRQSVKRDALDWLDRFALADKADKRPSYLSGGERQRVAIARAMVKRPAILLADEPTGNLDDETRDGVLDTIRALNRDDGTTVVLVTHDSDAARVYGDRTLCFAHRRLVDDTYHG
jgi:ABC-type lipoprotein export system ATPase subunit